MKNNKENSNTKTKKKMTEAGKTIINFAKKRNISLKTLADMLEISYSHLINMLNGSRDITDKTYKKIAAVLKLNKEEKYALKESVFVSNKEICIDTTNKRSNILHLIYWVTVKNSVLTNEQILEFTNIIKESKRNFSSDHKGEDTNNV